MSDQADTPAAAQAEAPKGPQMRSPKTIVLKRSGIVVVFDQDFSTEATIAAQRASSKNAGMFVIYLLQHIATFDGRRLMAGEIRDKIRGRDFLQLQGELLGDDEADDEDAGGPLN